MKPLPHRLLLLIASILLLGTISSAQEETKTIVLRDGTVIVGTIIRQTDDSLEVRSDSVTVTIAASSVRRIQNRAVRTTVQDSTVMRSDSVGLATAPGSITDAVHVWEIFAGVSIPTGPFAATDFSRIGFASTGMSVGGLYRLDVEGSFDVGFMGMFDYYPFNRDGLAKLLSPGVRMDVSPWYLIWTLGSFGLHTQLEPDKRLYAGVLLGYVYGISPKIGLSNGLQNVSQSSAASQGLAYGAQLGCYLRSLDIQVRYIASEIEYKYNTQSGSGFSIRQPTATVQIVVGIVVD